MRSARLVVVGALLLTACGTPVATAPPSASTSPAGPATSSSAQSAGPSPTDSPAPSAPPGSALTPSSPATAASTVTYATDFTLSGDELSFQPLTWYVGAKAQARCKEKKIKSDFEWCNAYYYENAGSRTSATLAPAVTVALLGDGTVAKPSTRAALVATLRAQNVGYAKLSRTADGVVGFEEVFTP